jgi:hypothetical protein
VTAVRLQCLRDLIGLIEPTCVAGRVLKRSIGRAKRNEGTRLLLLLTLFERKHNVVATCIVVQRKV